MRSAADWSSPSRASLACGDVNPRVVAALFVLALCALGAILLAAGGAREDPGDPQRFEGATRPPGQLAPDFELTDQDGDRIAMRSLRGRPVIVTFLYTTCEDTCPTQAQVVRSALGELGEDVPALAIAVDPPRDTPARARAFLSEQRMTGRMTFALGSRRQLEPVWKGFAVEPQRDDLEHTAVLLLVDPRGRQRVSYPVGEATPERLAHDVRLLAAGR